MKIFPSPVKDKMNVCLLDDNSKKMLILTDATGKRIYQQLLTDTITSLDFSKLAGGIYVVKITDAKGNILHSEKVLKN